MLRLNAYWQLYRKSPREIRIFFWTIVVFFLILIVPTAWTYARLYYARTQISDTSDTYATSALASNPLQSPQTENNQTKQPNLNK